MRVHTPTSAPVQPRPPAHLPPPNLGNAPPVRDSLTSLARPMPRPANASFHWDSVLSCLSSVRQTLTHLWKQSLDTAQVAFDTIIAFVTKLFKGAPQPPAPDASVPPARAPQMPAAVPSSLSLTALEPAVATSPAAVAEATPPAPLFASLASPGNEDKAHIDEIIHTTATNSVLWLGLSGQALSLKAKGDAVARNVHPLQFLAYIFSKDTLSEDMRQIHSESGKWAAFMDGTIITTGLATQLGAADNLVPYLEDFAAAVNRTSALSQLTDYATARDWDAFVEILIPASASVIQPVPSAASTDTAATAPARAELSALTQLTEAQKTTLRGILNKVAVKTTWGAIALMPSADPVVKQWKSLGFTHPFLLLEFLLTDHWDQVATISSNGWVYPAFYGSLADQLVTEPIRPLSHSLSDYVDEFAAKMGIVEKTPIDKILRDTVENPSILRWLVLINDLVVHKKATLASR